MKLSVVYQPAVSASTSPYRVRDNDGGELDWANTFLDAQRLRQLSPRSLRIYAYDLLNFARWFESQHQRLAEITESTIVDYVRHQLEQDRKPTPQTVNHRLGTVRCCYRFHTGQEIPLAKCISSAAIPNAPRSATAGPTASSPGASASNKSDGSSCRSRLKKSRSSGKASAPTVIWQSHQQLGRQLQPATLEEHYADEAFDGMPAVEEMRRQSDHFRIVTGNFTHYLLAAPTVPDCPHHDFGKSVELHCQAGELPIINRLIKTPRAYFTNTQLHHCCHKDVDAAKHVIISDENQPRCGVRSGRKGDVFCEIAPFDEFLCCRTCCFQQICTATEVLRLPCVRPPAG